MSPRLWAWKLPSVQRQRFYPLLFCDEIISCDWNEVSEQTFQIAPNGSPQGAFCNPVPPQAHVYFYLRPLHLWAVTHVAAWLAFLSLPFWHSGAGWELLSKTSVRFMAEKHDLARPDGLFEGRYHFSPSHLLNIAATFPQQRQSRQGKARTFIFKGSVSPSKSSKRPEREHTLKKKKKKIHATKIKFWIFGSENELDVLTPCSFIPLSIKECWSLQELIADPSQTETKWLKRFSDVTYEENDPSPACIYIYQHKLSIQIDQKYKSIKKGC